MRIRTNAPLAGLRGEGLSSGRVDVDTARFSDEHLELQPGAAKLERSPQIRFHNERVLQAIDYEVFTSMNLDKIVLAPSARVETRRL